MNLSRQDLYRIIIEEYLREEGIDEAYTTDVHKKFLKHIRGAPGGELPPPPESHSDLGASETYPMEKPFRAEMSQDDLVATIGELIRGKDPEEVSEIFELVFEKLPGAEIGDPEEEVFEPLYTPGAEGRPVAGFQLQELMFLVKEALEEGHYRDMGGPDDLYSVFDPEGIEQKSDEELIQMLRVDGMEDMIVLDGIGSLANREEVIAALKDV
jgi:hypothetical protein